jgi:hypothetical protein
MILVGAQLQADDGGFIALGDSDRYAGNGREEREGQAFAALWKFGNQSPVSSGENLTLDQEWLLAGNPPEAVGGTALVGFQAQDLGGYSVRRAKQGALLLFDAGQFGMPGASHHGHADTLAFEVHLPGTRFLVDPGGFSYVDFSARAYARSTAAHNTVRMDGRDSSQVTGEFNYGRSARAKNFGVTPVCGGYLFGGEHDGFAPEIHRRALLWIPGPPLRLLIFERLLGNQSHTMEVFHHGEEGWQCRLPAKDRVVWSKEPYRVVQVAWASQPITLTIAQGRVEPDRQGWISKKYGEYLKAPVVTCQCQGDLPVDIINVFVESDTEDIEIVIGGADGVLTIGAAEKFTWVWANDLPDISYTQG